jgi:two-component system chemotaxis response regulator CheY
VKVLVVDDSRAMRMIVMRALRQAGFGHHDYLQATNGQEALDICTDAQPDVVICDLNMPVMSGLEFATQLQELKLTPQLVFVTTESRESTRQEAMRLGGVRYINKPFKPEMLAARLESILG